MNKKYYISPQAESVCLKHQTHLLRQNTLILYGRRLSDTEADLWEDLEDYEDEGEL